MTRDGPSLYGQAPSRTSQAPGVERPRGFPLNRLTMAGHHPLYVSSCVFSAPFPPVILARLRGTPLLRVWLLISFPSLTPLLLSEQEPPPLGLTAEVVWDTLPPDSTRLLSQARRAQREFEDFHRSSLPLSSAFKRGGCDERVGRICLRHEEDAWEPRKEDSLVMAARETLLDTLKAIGRELPGDRWILGQRVQYLGLLGRWEEVMALHGDCQGGEPWWCPALLGYALHRSGQILEATDAFQRALDLMPPELARRWRDPAPLLDYSANRWVRNPLGMEESQANSLFWRMADPLFITPGNERLSEHFARHFAITLQSDAATTLDVSWGKGSEELLLRYGFAAGWERNKDPVGSSGEGTVIKHFHPESRGHLPPFEALEDPAGLPEDVWVSTDDPSRSASAPVLSPLLVNAVGQTAVLRRGGDLLVLAAYAIPTDSILQSRRGVGIGLGGEDSTPGLQRLAWEPRVEGSPRDTLAGLFLMADTGGWAPLSVMGAGGTGILQLRAPPGGYLLSLEQWNPAGRWGARLRHGIRVDPVPPDVPTLSDLLLLESGSALPEGLAEAIPSMRSSSVLGADEAVTVGWEVYGLGLRREALTFRVSLVEEEGSLIRRAFKRLGLFQRSPVLTLSWSEGGAGESGPLFRAVDLELPALDPGRYVLRLELDIPYRGKVFSNRRIIVR